MRQFLTSRSVQQLHIEASLAISLALAVIVGCGGTPAPHESVPPASANHDEQARVTDMHRHFDDINAIQLALISGNLVSTRELAKKIRAGFQGPAPIGWAPFIERSVASAEMLEVTSDLNMAARLAATMAGTCGDCHREHKVVVIDQLAIAPPHEDDTFSDFMTQHRWAADRLWEGLIGPSEEAWAAGAEALATSDLTTADVGDRLVITPEIEALLAQVRKDAAAARTTQGAEERQDLYGSFLAGCAGCHANMMNQRD